MKKSIVFSTILLGMSWSGFGYAETPEIKLKHSCIRHYPQAEGQTDQALLSLYAQVCDKKNSDRKNDLLAQVAMRFHELDQNLNALLLVNQLKQQNVRGTLLTDVAFLSGVAIAEENLQHMRQEEVRYLSKDLTYPAAKKLTEDIRLAMPAPEVIETKKESYKPRYAAPKKTYVAPVKHKTPATAVVTKPKTQKATVAPVHHNSSSPFAALR
ncbi:hypothetical protein [Acinetobacter sp. MB5]|uniref:hypothetical protein n=1 Tax=Acinetobacter sp. MB5 TaxID=2069438 RepID=UPI00196A2104|nr:hypothetical protein [Acinetobacter sp. MB5]